MEWVYGIFVVMVTMCVIVSRKNRKEEEEYAKQMQKERAAAAKHRRAIIKQAIDGMVEPNVWLSFSYHEKKMIRAERAWNRSQKRR